MLLCQNNLKIFTQRKELSILIALRLWYENNSRYIIEYSLWIEAGRSNFSQVTSRIRKNYFFTSSYSKIFLRSKHACSLTDIYILSCIPQWSLSFWSLPDTTSSGYREDRGGRDFWWWNKYLHHRMARNTWWYDKTYEDYNFCRSRMSKRGDHRRLSSMRNWQVGLFS